MNKPITAASYLCAIMQNAETMRDVRDVALEALFAHKAGKLSTDALVDVAHKLIDITNTIQAQKKEY